jgi:hypothetical protein
VRPRPLVRPQAVHVDVKHNVVPSADLNPRATRHGRTFDGTCRSIHIWMLTWATSNPPLLVKDPFGWVLRGPYDRHGRRLKRAEPRAKL